MGGYVITQATLAIADRDGRRDLITLPAGSVIQADESHGEPNELVEVLWNGERVLMFNVDLKNRGERLQQHAA